MSKKLLSLLLAVCMLFCLSACGTTETSSNKTNTPSETQTDTAQNTDENTLGEENSQVSSNTEETNESKSTQTQTQTNQSNPNTNQSTHAHSYSNATCTSPKRCSCGVTEGKALGHQFSLATCTTPKTCSRCGKTEGKASEHNYKEGICTVCNAVHEQKYVDAQIDAAEKAFKDHTKYNDALKIIKVALQKFPQNNTLKTKRDYYQSFAPLYLSDVEPYAKSYWFKRCDSDTDVFKTTHNHCIRIEKNFTSADGTYDLSAKYNTFKATIYGLGDGNLGSLKIYADGVCVYSNTSISVNTRPIEIQLDITGVMDLKFEMKQDYNSYTGECFGLSNVYVQKTKK